MIGNHQQQTQTGMNMNGSPAGTQTNFNPNPGTITNLLNSVNQNGGGMFLNKTTSVELGNNNTVLNGGGTGNNVFLNNANQNLNQNPNALSPNPRSGQFFQNSDNNNFGQGVQGFSQGGAGFGQVGQGFNQGGQGFSQSGQGFNTGIRSNNLGYGGGLSNNNNLYNTVNPSGNMGNTMHCNVCHNNISPNKNLGAFGLGISNTMMGTQSLGAANTFNSNFNNGLLDASVVNYQNLFQQNHQFVNEKKIQSRSRAISPDQVELMNLPKSKGNLNYPNGSSYNGEYISNGMRHGTGTFIFPDKSKYEGGWQLD